MCCKMAFQIMGKENLAQTFSHQRVLIFYTSVTLLYFYFPDLFESNTGWFYYNNFKYMNCS